MYRRVYNQQTPYSGGLGAPGQKSTRVETLKSEIARIWKTTGGMILFVSIAFLSVINILGILGPWLGWGIGVCVIVCSFVFLRAWIKHKYPEQLTVNLEIGIVVCVVIALTVWALVGLGWVESWWLPPCHLGFWIELVGVVFHLVVIGALGWGTWGLWGELVDPNGPTAPRKATARETLIKPWDQETYGGRYFDDEDTPAPIKSIDTISVEITDQNGEHDKEYISDLPSLPAFRQFCAHVAQGHITFSEAKAREYMVPLDDVRDDRGALLMMGMRSFRQFALDRKPPWIEWKNPKVHARGVIMSDKFLKILAAIGGVTVNTPATE